MDHRFHVFYTYKFNLCLLGTGGRGSREDMVYNKSLPDYRSKEHNVLYIIGNGFDLYHGLNTNYFDFYNWAEEKYPNFIYMMENLYPEIDPKDNKLMLWKDFEEALKHNKDLQKIHEFTLDYVSDFESLPIEKQQTFASEEVKKTLDKITPYLKEWTKTFSEKYEDVKKILPLRKNSKYITFNYTRVLEDVYGIDGNEHVWHIHGSVNDKNVITGYDTRLISETIFGTSIEEASEREILKELQKMRKPTETIYTNRPKAFKDPLYEINTIIVIGHSLADVDIPYFRYMIEPLSDSNDIEWQFWVHKKEAQENIHERVKQLRSENSCFENKISESRCKYYIMDDWKKIEERIRKQNEAILFE